MKRIVVDISYDTFQYLQEMAEQHPHLSIGQLAEKLIGAQIAYRSEVDRMRASVEATIKPPFCAGYGPMNATRPEWIDLVRKAAETYSVAELPSLADEFGHGRWRLVGNPTVRADGTSLWVLYWEVGTLRVDRHSVRVGDFDGKPRQPKHRRKDLPAFQTELTIGWDEHGRRVMREKDGQLALVIEIDQHGLPIPVPIERYESVSITPNYHHA